MNYLLAGLSLGFAAGISPGPLLTLVITRTLECCGRQPRRVKWAKSDPSPFTHYVSQVTHDE